MCMCKTLMILYSKFLCYSTFKLNFSYLSGKSTKATEIIAASELGVIADTTRKSWVKSHSLLKKRMTKWTVIIDCEPQISGLAQHKVMMVQEPYIWAVYFVCDFVIFFFLIFLFRLFVDLHQHYQKGHQSNQ